MPDVAASSFGTKVLLASSLDEAHPAENVIDAKGRATYWISTGLYPQELMLEFECPVVVHSARMLLSGVHQLQLDGCHETTPVHFTTMARGALDPANPAVQVADLPLATLEDDKPVRFLRLIILSGSHDFCSVHELQVEGERRLDTGMSGATSPKSGKKSCLFQRASSRIGLSNATGPKDDLEVRIPEQAVKAVDEPDAPHQTDNFKTWDGDKVD